MRQLFCEVNLTSPYRTGLRVGTLTNMTATNLTRRNTLARPWGRAALFFAGVAVIGALTLIIGTIWSAVEYNASDPRELGGDVPAVSAPISIAATVGPLLIGIGSIAAITLFVIYLMKARRS